ncbi:MAG: protoheme IX farnesyltransferase [Bacteroidia bacterium]|nr:protoheme IX farnesyltransferase [Bacteroidia bacterium]MDW8133815.1 protoheme IX farnesyltransferase [Bacteroidia bacterium]
MQVPINLSLPFLSKLGAYLQLTKPRLTILVVFSSVMGALIGGLSDLSILGWLLLGGYAITGSANTMNQVWEHATDSLMERTCRRPIPAGIISIRAGLIFGILLVIIGIFTLSLIREDVAIIGFLGWLLYLLGYTPLKKKGLLAVFLGAVAGALPPVIGYWSVSPAVSPLLIAIFMLQFFWQFPHFWVIAWIARRDYERAGFHFFPFSPMHTRSNWLVFHFMLGALPVVSIILWPWLPWRVEAWILVLGLLVSGIGLYLIKEEPNQKSLRYFLFTLSVYLTLLYLGIWLLR